ncbi:MAG: LysM peptidoglycan-binding domain-containing protein [Anaerolineales bacterium]|nr:LysM peptidoglycan-binding domain-containing protein [Anaerolineales bacterium]
MSIKKFVQLLLLFLLLGVSILNTTPAQAASSCGTTYTVLKGDTLTKIAQKCGTTVSVLRRANPEIGSGDKIYPGQVLLLPGALVKGKDGFDTYIVARGDTLKALAKRFETTVEYLLSLNPDIKDPDVIYEGQRLVVPAAGSIPTPPPSPSGHTYTVQKGDTLRKIASWTFTTVDALLEVNPQIKNPNKIYVGQVINLPAEVNRYTVQKGDTLSKIARKFNTTVDSLKSLNNLSDPDKLSPGQILRLW